MTVKNWINAVSSLLGAPVRDPDMVKITLHGVGGQKADKEGDGDKADVLVPCPPHEDLALHLHSRRSPVKSLWCLVLSLAVFLCGLVLASIYLYRHYFVAQCSVSLSS
ncbi:integral membrane protein 2C-like isoform X1 [Arapaima gigas]